MRVRLEEQKKNLVRTAMLGSKAVPLYVLAVFMSVLSEADPGDCSKLSNTALFIMHVDELIELNQVSRINCHALHHVCVPFQHIPT